MDTLIYDSKTAESLIGFKITQAVQDADDDSGFFGFKAKKGRKEIIVWVLMDPEGNGAGCLDVCNIDRS